MTSIEDLLISFGPIAVFSGTACEGDVTMILAGVVAHLGFFAPPVALLCGWLGAFTGDCAYYWLGRMRAESIQRSRFYVRAAPFIERVAGQAGPWEIVAARFVYGTRTASMIFWGVRRLPFAQFALFDLIGCGLWAVVLGSLGYAFSGSAEVLIGEVKRAEIWLLIAFVLAAAAVFMLHTRLRPRLSGSDGL